VEPQFAISMCRDLILTTLLLTAPVVVTSLVVGLLISVLQAITSIQEQTLSFAPRIAAVAIAMVVTLPWTIQVITTYTHRVLWHLTEVVK
jgi:flagellar biosynthesis protein FliQ